MCYSDLLSLEILSHLKNKITAFSFRNFRFLIFLWIKKIKGKQSTLLHFNNLNDVCSVSITKIKKVSFQLQLKKYKNLSCSKFILGNVIFISL